MNYHGKMMNIPTKVFPTADWEHAYEYYPEVAKAPEVQLAYKYGHRDARHAAAEIALEADRTIEELQEENAKLVTTLTDASLKSTLALNTELIRENTTLRASLEACDVVMDTAAIHGLPQQLPPTYRDSWAWAHTNAREALKPKENGEGEASEGREAQLMKAALEAETLLTNYLYYERFPKDSDCEQVKNILRDALRPYVGGPASDTAEPNEVTRNG